MSEARLRSGKCDHTHNCLSNAIAAMNNIHVVMARLPGTNPLQSYLLDAMHSMLVVAEECRQNLQERDDDQARSRITREPRREAEDICPSC